MTGKIIAVRHQNPRQRSRHGKLRTSIYQASWNYQYRHWYPKVTLGVSIALGLWLSSWWAFLCGFFLLSALPHFTPTVGFFSLIWGLSWTALITIPVAMNYSVGAAVTTAVFVFSIAWVPLRASEQYWRDLEKDGGPYSD